MTMLRGVLHRLNERREGLEESSDDLEVKRSWMRYGVKILHLIGSYLPEEARDVVNPKYFDIILHGGDLGSFTMIPSVRIEGKMLPSAFPPFRKMERFFGLSLPYLKFWKEEAREGKYPPEEVEGNRVMEERCGARFLSFLFKGARKAAEKEADVHIDAFNFVAPFAPSTPLGLEVIGRKGDAPLFNFKQMAPEL